MYKRSLYQAATLAVALTFTMGVAMADDDNGDRNDCKNLPDQSATVARVAALKAAGC